MPWTGKHCCGAFLQGKPLQTTTEHMQIAADHWRGLLGSCKLLQSMCAGRWCVSRDGCGSRPLQTNILDRILDSLGEALLRKIPCSSSPPKAPAPAPAPGPPNGAGRASWARARVRAAPRRVAPTLPLPAWPRPTNFARANVHANPPSLPGEVSTFPGNHSRRCQGT